MNKRFFEGGAGGGVYEAFAGASYGFYVFYAE